MIEHATVKGKIETERELIVRVGDESVYRARVAENHNNVRKLIE